MNKQTLHFFLLLIILAVAIANRFYGLDRLSLWADELWVVMASSKGSLLDMFSFVYLHDNHPPGHYLFTRYWQMIFGSSDYAIRFPFAVVGVFLVYSTYIIAKEHYSAEAGLIGAALISSSWQAIYYSQEARANIFVAATALWTLNYFYRLVYENIINNKNLIGFWLTAIFCCYLHYVGMVFVACLSTIFVVLSLWRRQKTFFALGLKLFLPVLLLYSPWLPGMYYHLTHKPPGAWWGVPEGFYFYDNFVWIFGFGAKIFFLYQWAFVFFGLLFLLCVIDNKKINIAMAKLLDKPLQEYRRAMLFSSLLLLMTVIPPLVFFIKSKISQPVYDYRHFIFTIPYMAMGAGYLVSVFFVRLRSWMRGVILASTVIFLILIQNYFNILGKLYLGPHFKAEYRQTVAALVNDHNLEPTEAALIIANSQFFNHYLERSQLGRNADSILMNTQQLAVLNAQIEMQRPTRLYFLETPESHDRSMVSSLDVELAKVYQPVCRMRFVYAQLIKFNTTKTNEVSWDALPTCN